MKSFIRMTLWNQHIFWQILTYNVNIFLEVKSLFQFTYFTLLVYTHTTALHLGLPGWAGTRKVKPIWILLKQETVSGNGISWAICKSAPRSGQITMPAPHHSVLFTFLQEVVKKIMCITHYSCVNYKHPAKTSIPSLTRKFLYSKCHVCVSTTAVTCDRFLTPCMCTNSSSFVCFWCCGLQHYNISICIVLCLQCFDAVGLAAGRASGL